MVLAHITLHMLNACCMRMRRHRQVFFCSQSQPNRCSQSTSSISTMYCSPSSSNAVPPPPPPGSESAGRCQWQMVMFAKAPPPQVLQCHPKSPPPPPPPTPACPTTPPRPTPKSKAGPKAPPPGVFVIGMGGDNDTNYQLFDHVIVGVPSKLEECNNLSLPFFAQLQHVELHVECFPYRIAMATRPARGNTSEPFYSSRDPNHTAKAATRALTSPRRIVTLGGLFVHHAHALERGMPTRAFYSNHGQSDKESSQRAIEAASVAEQEHVEAAKQDSEVNASIIQGKHPQDGEKVAVTVCVALRIQQTAPPPKTHIVSKNTSTHKPKEHTNPRRAHLQLAGV